MSALQASTDDNAVDLVSQLQTLIDRIEPLMSRIVDGAIAKSVLDEGGNKLSAFCQPLNQVYVMTSAGLAKLVKLRHSFKKLPQLIPKDKLKAIDLREIREITEELTTLLQKHNRAFPAYRA
ncbi:MAG TPA: hypothetical protein VIM37_03685 [Candidatus Microsaccharimonas sp.]|jgi:hypothetical protein